MSAASIDLRLYEVPLLCALDRSPWLAIDGPGGRRALPAPPAEGTPPIAPRCGPAGHVAYLHVAARPVGPEWTCALVILSPAGELLDLRPSALVHAPPSFDAAGVRVLYVRDVDGLAREIVELQLATGAERILSAGEGIRCAAWTSDGRVLASRVDSIVAIDPVRNVHESLVDDPVASGFARFGTDDLYVTLDAVAVSSLGDRAWARTWHRQGRPSRSHVVLERQGCERQEWQDVCEPRFFGAELVVRSGAAVSVPESGERREVAGLCGFDRWSQEGCGDAA